MITAVLNVAGFVKHLNIDMAILHEGRLRVAVPRVIADLHYGEPPDNDFLKVIEFELVRYDAENHIAYFGYGKWA